MSPGKVYLYKLYQFPAWMLKPIPELKMSDAASVQINEIIFINLQLCSCTLHVNVAEVLLT